MTDENKGKESIKRVMPRSDLDFNLMTTDAVWGSPYISAELRERLGKEFKEVDKEGNETVTTASLWGLLGFYTRDMRLANLSILNGEVNYCQYYLDLANDFLQADMIEPFLISLSRVATVLELSQSKGGFLRRRMNTFSTEHTQLEEGPKKKSLFGKQQKREG